MRLSWRDLGMPRADKAHGKAVEITGFPVTILPTPTADRFLMMAEPGCCAGCVPNNPLAVVEVVADRPLKLGNGTLRLKGRLQVSDDPAVWRYQLHAAEVMPSYEISFRRRQVRAADREHDEAEPQVQRADLLVVRGHDPAHDPALVSAVMLVVPCGVSVVVDYCAHRFLLDPYLRAALTSAG